MEGSDEVLKRIEELLTRTSVRGEELESDKERAKLDEIGDTANRDQDLLIIRALELDTAVGGLTSDEMSRLTEQLALRRVLASLVSEKQIAERVRSDGTFAYGAPRPPIQRKNVPHRS